MSSMPTDRHWDARWDAEKRREAVRLSEERLRTARIRFDTAADMLREASDWLGSVRYFAAMADSREAGDLAPEEVRNDA